MELGHPHPPTVRCPPRADPAEELVEMWRQVDEGRVGGVGVVRRGPPVNRRLQSKMTQELVVLGTKGIATRSKKLLGTKVAQTACCWASI